MLRCLVLLGLLLTAATAQARVDYAIDLTAPEHHTARVSMEFPETAAPFLDVKMAAWRTGRYSILPLANGVREFAASDSAGRPLRWEKIDNSTWRIHLEAPTTVRVGYELYGNELALRTRHIDDSHAYLNASAVFMYADRYRADDITVALNVPPRWNSVSGMRSVGEHRFVAENWDIFVDSPIETGINRVLKFQEDGRDYEVVFWGEGNYDAERTSADLQRIVAQAPSIWSSYPFQRYVFIVQATDGAGGATEHRNSTVIQRPRFSFQPRGRYIDFLSTASHEFVHTWNVKAYRPAGLVPYDYQQENFTDLLWIAEGSTSYFEDQLLLRGGVITPHEYLGRISDVIRQHQNRPGTAVQSVAEASFDEWIAPSGDRASNAAVSIYTQGQMVSWMLDIALLEQTGGRVSYRDVHEALYRRFDADERGYTAQDVLQILRELTGKSWEDWWARNARSPATVDFDRLLRPVGLALNQSNGAGKPWAGWSAEQVEGGMRLLTVPRGSPAWDAGFTPGDIIVAFDGQRVTEKRFADAMAERRAGDAITVSYFRRDRLAQKTLRLGSSRGEPRVVLAPNATRAQKALFQRWLLVPYPAS